MSGDIVERLRAWIRPAGTNIDLPLYSEAADEIERLQDYKRKQMEDIITLGQQVGKLEVENVRLRTDLEQLRELVAIQAEDDALWLPYIRIETAHVQQALRLLTWAIEGEWTFEQARDAIRDMMP